MRNKMLKILLVLILLGGAALFLYPEAADYINRQRQAEVIRKYQDEGNQIDKKKYEEEFLEAQEYNRMLAKQPDFTHAVLVAEKEQSDRYERLLNLSENGVMGTISIPKLNVLLPIYHGTDETYLARGVGHQIGSSLPIGGEGTHTVLAGHRGLPSSELFTKLDELVLGDLFVISTLGKEYTYAVDQIITVTPENTQELEIVKGKDYATLLTCTPYGINTHRLLIRGIRTDNISKEQQKEIGSDLAERKELPRLVINAGIVVMILLVTALLMRGKKGGRR